MFFAFLFCLNIYADTRNIATIVLNARTKKTLQQHRADTPHPPASLVKMMTLYLVFEDLKARKITLKDMISTPKKATQQERVRINLKIGQKISVHDAILAIAVKSANDAAYGTACHLNGSEEAFATRMNIKAKTLGLRHSNFKNASGLPHPEQVTTARDMALLARALVQDFPEYYKTFKTQFFAFNGQTHKNSNQLLGLNLGVDGIKTGYANKARHNLATSAIKNGQRLILIVLGAPTKQERDRHTVALLKHTCLAKNIKKRPVAKQKKCHERWGAQVGGFTTWKKASNYANKLRTQFQPKTPLFRRFIILKNKRLFKPQFGPFKDVRDAKFICHHLGQAKVPCFIQKI